MCGATVSRPGSCQLRVWFIAGTNKLLVIYAPHPPRSPASVPSTLALSSPPRPRPTFDVISRNVQTVARYVDATKGTIRLLFASVACLFGLVVRDNYSAKLIITASTGEVVALLARVINDVKFLHCTVEKSIDRKMEMGKNSTSRRRRKLHSRLAITLMFVFIFVEMSSLYVYMYI